MYLWVVIVGGIFAFFAAAGIGSNDAANAFATSVGSKALTIKQAVVLAAIFETAGAILMGSHVTNTIRKGIADYKCFEDEPYLLMYGCMWVIFTVGTWLFIASYYEMPVSTTHSCVGGMIGMAIALKGSNCVIWYNSRHISLCRWRKWNNYVLVFITSIFWINSNDGFLCYKKMCS